MSLDLSWLKDAAQYAMLVAGGAWETAAYLWMIGENIIADIKKAAVKDATISGIDPDAPRQLIYGERRVGGTITYVNEKIASNWEFDPTQNGDYEKFLIINYTVFSFLIQEYTGILLLYYTL